MKRVELSRSLKSELWKLFGKGLTVTSVEVVALHLPTEAVEKQFRIWSTKSRKTHGHS